MSEQRSHIMIRRAGGVFVVDFADRKILDELVINEISEELTALISQHSGIRLLLNFEHVEHMTSAALGMLITLRQKVQEAGGTLKLAGIIPQIYEVFKITRLNHVFEIHDNQSGALAAFG